MEPVLCSLQPVGSEIQRTITIGSRALDAEIAEQEPVCERNYYFGRSAYRAVRDSGVLQDAQATTGRRVRITKDVPVLRIDHISIKGMLLGVWPVYYHGECDPIVGNCRGNEE
jgi:hypothetical protein